METCHRSTNFHTNFKSFLNDVHIIFLCVYIFIYLCIYILYMYIYIYICISLQLSDVFPIAEIFRLLSLWWAQVREINQYFLEIIIASGIPYSNFTLLTAKGSWVCSTLSAVEYESRCEDAITSPGYDAHSLLLLQLVSISFYNLKCVLWWKLLLKSNIIPFKNGTFWAYFKKRYTG